MEFTNQYLLFATVFFSFKWLSPLFPQTLPALVQAGSVQVKQHQVFQSLGCFCCIITFWWKFLSRIARSAFSFSQCSMTFQISTLGPPLPLKHILKPLMDSVSGDVRDPHKLYQAPACFSRTWENKSEGVYQTLQKHCLDKLGKTGDYLWFNCLCNILKHRAKQLCQHES